MLPRGLLARVLLMTISLVGCSALEHRSPAPTDPPPSTALSIADTIAPALPEPSIAPEDQPTEPAAQRIYSLRRHVWIRERPSSRSRWIGFLGLGGAVRTQGQPVRGHGCDAFYAVEPRGFVCLDDKTTLDPATPSYVAIRHIAPHTEGAFLHRYGEAREAPRYWVVPTAKQQTEREFSLVRHLQDADAMRSGTSTGDDPPMLQGVSLRPAGVGPPAWLGDLPVVHEFRNRAPAGSAVTWTSSFDAEGRTWLVTGDGALIPQDKVAPFEQSAFRGIVLDATTTLPLAFAREKPRPRYVHEPDGSVRLSDKPLERLSWTRLTGQVVDEGRRRYLETTDAGLLVDEREVVVVRASAVTPWGEPVDGASPSVPRRWTGSVPKPPLDSRQTWIEASVHEGWLIAYEGRRPIFATLAASGRGEPAGASGFVQTSTATGVFSIQGKYFTETMDIGALVHFDVPFVMPFHNSYAIHAAYWHDRWGEKVSLGCLNLSPRDARWLFDWAEPAIPEGWHGMTVHGAGGYATVVVVHA